MGNKKTETQATTFLDVAQLFNSSKEFQGAVLPVGEAQLNRGGAGKGDPAGLLVKAQSLQKILWTSKKPPIDVGAWKGTVKFGKEKKEEEVYIFPNPRLSVIAVSPRIIEATLEEKLAVTSNAKSLKLGVYSVPGEDKINQIITPETQKMKLVYEILSKDETTRTQCGIKSVGLRSFYLLMLLDPETNELLHQQPLCLSIKGLSAVDLGRSLEQVNADFQIAVVQANGVAKSLSMKALSALWVQPSFSQQMGGANSVPYAGIGKDEHEKYLIGWGVPGNIEMIQQRITLFDSIRESNKDFSDKLISYHNQVNQLWGDNALVIKDILDKVEELIPSDGCIALPQSMSNSFILNGATDEDFDIPRLTSAPLSETDDVTIDTEVLNDPPF